MATTPLTTQSITYAGVTPSFTAAGGAGAGNGFTFTNDGSTYFRIKNASGAQITCTVKATGAHEGVANVDQTFTVAATTGDVIWKGSPGYFGGTTTIEVSAATSVTACAFK